MSTFGYNFAAIEKLILKQNMPKTFYFKKYHEINKCWGPVSSLWGFVVPL